MVNDAFNELKHRFCIPYLKMGVYFFDPNTLLQKELKRGYP